MLPDTSFNKKTQKLSQLNDLISPKYHLSQQSDRIVRQQFNEHVLIMKKKTNKCFLQMTPLINQMHASVLQILFLKQPN